MLKLKREKSLDIRKRQKELKQRQGLETLYISQHGDLPTGLKEKLAGTDSILVVNNKHTLAEALLKKIYYYGVKGDDGINPTQKPRSRP